MRRSQHGVVLILMPHQSWDTHFRSVTKATATKIIELLNSGWSRLFLSFYPQFINFKYIFHSLHTLNPVFWLYTQ